MALSQILPYPFFEGLSIVDEDLIKARVLASKESLHPLPWKSLYILY